MSKHKWATMHDVAIRANVGKITVSRVLRTPEKVAEKTRQRVLDAIRELGYVPDGMAGALSSSRSRIVGALVSTLADSVFTSTIEGLSRTLRRSDYELLLANTDYAPELEEAAVRTLLSRRPDGLALTSSQHTPQLRELLLRSNVPVVELWDLPENPIGHVVGFSNRLAGRAITEYLIAQSHRKIAFIGGNRSGDVRGQQRAEGYREVLLEAGLGTALFIDSATPELSDVEAGAQGLSSALERWPDLDAVICVSDPLAMGALCEAARQGVTVPTELAVSGFGGLELSQPAGLNLTTIEFPGKRIGEMAADILMNSEGNDTRQIIDLGFELVRRATA